jgi:hypothetical protein
MSYNLGRPTQKPAPLRRLFVAVLVLAGAFGNVTCAVAKKKITTPVTPAAITPPLGNTAFLVGYAVGTQGYVCLPMSTGASWTVNGSRPEATLFAGSSKRDKQIATHFLSPNTNPNQFAPKPLPFGSATWQSSSDSSKVWAQKQQAIPAGSDRTSCPNSGAIDCLLLQVIGSEPGPAGGKFLTKATFIQRLNTSGGSAPADGCSTSADMGKQTLVPYSADYYFFRRDK